MRPFVSGLSLLFFISCLLAACSSVRIFTMAEVDEPPLLPLNRKWEHSLPPTAGNRLQSFLYGNLKYPAVARKIGIQANVRASYQIKVTGEIDKLEVKEVVFNDGFQTVKAILSDTIIQLAFHIPQVDYGHGNYVAPPISEYNHQDTLAGYRVLVQEVERVMGLLPVFQPAYHNGKPVAVKKTTDFIFRLE